MVETDSPYLAPVPHRGKPNRPAHVAVVGEYLAQLRGVDGEHFAQLTSATTRSFYGLGTDGGVALSRGAGA